MSGAPAVKRGLRRTDEAPVNDAYGVKMNAPLGEPPHPPRQLWSVDWHAARSECAVMAHAATHLSLPGPEAQPWRQPLNLETACCPHVRPAVTQSLRQEAGGGGAPQFSRHD